MIQNFKLPEIGEGVMEGEILEWLAEEGSMVEKDSPIVSVLTDKATIELSCPFKGQLKQILKKAGEVVQVGSNMAHINTKESSIKEPNKAIQYSGSTQNDYFFKLPEVGEGVMEGEVVEWKVSKGDDLERDQIMVSILTDKATIDITSPCLGTVKEILVSAGTVAAVGQDLIIIATQDSMGADLSSQTPITDNEIPVTQSQKHISEAGNPSLTAFGIPLASPAVRRKANQRGIDLTSVKGSGPGNRITMLDLDNFNGAHGTKANYAHGSNIVFSIKKRSTREKSIREPIKGLRKAIFKSMSLSKKMIPHYTYVAEVEMDALVNLRNDLKDTAQEQGVKLSFLPFIMKAVTLAMEKFPVINTSVDEEEFEVIYHSHINLGIATSTDHGLMVPVIKHADQMNLLELASLVHELSGKARARRTSMDEVSGGTFTITSLGKLGGLLATPIINYPESAILGVHEIAKRAVVRNGQIVIRQMMNLAGSFDHRIIDGDVGAAFIQEVRSYLEHPGRLLNF